jgi:regulation of enolase protein 1 (concanavalin A-like superfamily)
MSAPVVVTVVGGPMPTPPESPALLPASWSNQDVGSVTARGNTTTTGGAWTMTASGADVWGAADAFQFAYRTLSGDGSITARVTSVSATNAWTKAGVMMREDLGPGSRHAFMLLTPSDLKGFAFQRRVSPGGESLHTAGGVGTAPQWVRLTRVGTVITGQYSADGVVWTTVGSESIPMNTTILVGLALTSHDESQMASATFDNVTLDGPVVGSPLSSWSSTDVGTTASPGSSSLSNATWTVRGSGADIWGTADAFHFVMQPLTGDGTIVARVTSFAGTDAWAKAGVMVRESLDASSPHAFALVTPGGAHGVAFQRRVVASDVSVHTAGPGVAAPVWLKLTRRGAWMTASWSSDGVAWSVIGTENLPMATVAYVGLAVTSHDEGTLAAATFDNVSVTAEGGEDVWASHDIGAVHPSGSTAGDGSALVVTASGGDIWDTADAFRLTYRVVSGDFDVTAHVDSVEAVNQWTKAGVMVRGSMSAGSAHASLFATPSVVKGIAFQRRETADAQSLHTAGPALAPAVWLRLSRRGNAVTAWYRVSSLDTWVAIDTDAIELPAAVFVGAAVTSHQEGVLATAVFDNVSIVAVP